MPARKKNNRHPLGQIAAAEKSKRLAKELEQEQVLEEQVRVLQERIAQLRAQQDQLQQDEEQLRQNVETKLRKARRLK